MELLIRIPIDHPEDNEINFWIEKCSKNGDNISEKSSTQNKSV